MIRLLLCAAVFLAMAPAHEQRATTESPVHATLRMVGERTSFQMGEPVRLELVLTADKPGFVVDTLGADDPSDVLTINPEDGVHRLEGIGGRDVFTALKLTTEPVVIGLAANYWVRFDRAGSYTVSIKTRRVSQVGPDGGLSTAQPLQLFTNPVTFRIEPTSIDDEQELIASAVRNLQSAVAMGLGDRAFTAQIRAAEELAFLTSDAAALEKYRWYRELGAPQGIIRRGFQMSRNPEVILALVEAELQDLNQAVSTDMIYNAASLAVTIKYPGVRQNLGYPVPPGGSDPLSLERARYLEIVHRSLDRRSGLVKLLSAGAMLDMLANSTPADVVQIIVDGFEQFPVRSRSWFASGRWDVIRDVRLGPALRRTLDEVEPGSRSSIFPALIDVAPSLALEPLSSDILDPRRIVSAEIVRKMPRASLSHLAPQLVATIRKMSPESGADTFRIEQKLELLGLIADGTVLSDVRRLYGSHPKFQFSARASLLRYLLEFDPEEGTRRLKEVLASGDRGTSLFRIASDGPPLPALNAVLREHLFDRDPGAAAEAAELMAREARAEDRDAIELRLLQWRLDRQQRMANGEPLNDADGSFESRMVQALAQTLRLKGPGPDRDRLLAACLTDACKAAFAR